MVSALLNGSTKYNLVEIVDAAYALARSTGRAAGDDTGPSNGLFSRTRNAAEIRHAHEGLLTWAIQTTLSLVQAEGAVLVEYDTGLHLRAGVRAKKTTTSKASDAESRAESTAALPAQTTSEVSSSSCTEGELTMADGQESVEGRATATSPASEAAHEAETYPTSHASGEHGNTSIQDAGSTLPTSRRDSTEGSVSSHAQTKRTRTAPKPRPEALVTWDRLNLFSFVQLRSVLETKAPVFWHIVNGYANSTYGKEGQVAVVRKSRPQTLVSLSAPGFEVKISKIVSIPGLYGTNRSTHLYTVQPRQPLCARSWRLALRNESAQDYFSGRQSARIQCHL